MGAPRWCRLQREALNPYKDGNPFSQRVARIRRGENPHPHTLAEAIYIAQRQIEEENRTPRIRVKI